MKSNQDYKTSRSYWGFVVFWIECDSDIKASTCW